MADVVYAVANAWVDETTFLRRGQMFAANDPLVESRPDLFTDDPTEFLVRPAPPVVEQATAAPGELRRGPGRPRKDGNGPWLPAEGGVA